MLLRSQFTFEVKKLNYPFWIVLPVMMWILPLLSIAVFLFSGLINPAVYIALLVINFVKDLVGSLALFGFLEEVVILMRHSFYIHIGTGYRTHRRQFSKKYDSGSCNKKI